MAESGPTLTSVHGQLDATYGKSPIALVRSGNVYALAVYTFLDWRAGRCRVAFPTIETIVQETATSRASVLRSLKWLEENGWITVERTHRRASHYRILPLPNWDPESISQTPTLGVSQIPNAPLGSPEDTPLGVSQIPHPDSVGPDNGHGQEAVPHARGETGTLPAPSGAGTHGGKLSRDEHLWAGERLGRWPTALRTYFDTPEGEKQMFPDKGHAAALFARLSKLGLSGELVDRAIAIFFQRRYDWREEQWAKDRAAGRTLTPVKVTVAEFESQLLPLLDIAKRQMQDEAGGSR
jgi:hypothetical protein